jgi:hypothetical protein
MEYSQKQKEEFRKRLKKIIGKKITTTMVYPISEFEAAFGELWGHDKPEEVITEEQKSFRIKWLQCRNNIFNMGNQQRRNACAEIDMHDVVWHRFQTILYVPKTHEELGDNNE